MIIIDHETHVQDSSFEDVLLCGAPHGILMHHRSFASNLHLFQYEFSCISECQMSGLAHKFLCISKGRVIIATTIIKYDFMVERWLRYINRDSRKRPLVAGLAFSADTELEKK